MSATAAQPAPPPSYWERREEIAGLAAGIDSPPATVEYRPVEHDVWAAVAGILRQRWNEHAATDVLAGRDRLALPLDRIPQLTDVTDRLRPLTGFEFHAVAGLIPTDDFFAGLARRRFSSTQYVRWEGSPWYTPEPDVIHEVMGHANCLACPEIAELHRLAGEAMGRLTDAAARHVVADVFWFSAEFGVITEDGRPKAYGAGLLSSPGEVAWFADHAEVRPLDLAEMATLDYDIDHYQPVLFAGESTAHVLDVVGGFFADATDGSVRSLVTR